MRTGNVAEEVNEPIETILLVNDKRSRASDVLARAFHDDPLYRRILPAGDERTPALRGLFGAVVGYTLRYGLVYTTPPVDGAACWLSPGNTRVTFWRMLRTGMAFQRVVARLSADVRRQLLDALAYTDEIHKRLMAGPAMDAHWYLWALGVTPSCQGQGIGGALIRPVLTQSDGYGMPCYLETLNRENIAFYQRWGFEVRADEIVPGVDVRVWSMIREPGQ